jgi:hypothetical protein
MLNNINNFFNLVRGKRIKTTLAPSDLIAVGVRDVTNKSDYQPAAIQFEDLRTQLGNIQSVSVISPLVSTGGVNPVVSMPQATALVNGYLSAIDWNTFNKYNTVEDEGVPVTQRTNLNFVGPGVIVTDVGGKTQVTITGGGAGGTVRTVQLGVTEASSPAALALLGETLIRNHVGSGQGVLINTRWQFVISADFSSNGQIVLDVQRPGNALQAQLFVYVNGAISNINGTSFNPTASGVWQTFTIALTTPVVAGDTITVLAQPSLSNGQNLYIRDSYFNYQS